MPSRFSLLLAGLLCLLTPAAALALVQEPVREPPAPAAEQAPEQPPEQAKPWAPRTGDAVVDARLADINVYAERFSESFLDELVRYFDAPRPLLEALLGQGAAAGDLYYACALARVTGRPCRGVIEAWQAGDDEGWEAVARRLGVEPGDERARRLRAGIAESYQRWGRSLPGG